MSKLRDRIFAASRKLCVRLGMTHPEDLRVRDSYHTYDLHLDHGIVVTPRVYALGTWYEGYYRFDQHGDGGDIVLTGVGGGRPPDRIRVRGTSTYGSMVGGADVEQELIGLYEAAG